MDLEKAEEPEINCQHLLGHRKSKGIQKNKIYLCFIDFAKAIGSVNHSKMCKILKEMEIPGCLTSLLRNLYAAKKKTKQTNKQKKTVRSGHRTTFWFQIGTGVRQGCVLSPCLFNLYRVHHVKCQVDKAQAGINIAGVNINNLRYADGTTLR